MADENISMPMWRVGKEFILDALKLRPMIGGDAGVAALEGNLSVPAYYLLAHGIELQLKAFLLTKGYTLDSLRNKFGHNLDKLFADSKDQGIEEYVKFQYQHKQNINLLCLLYADHVLTYFNPNRRINTFPSYERIGRLAVDISNGLRCACIPQKYHKFRWFIKEEISITTNHERGTAWDRYFLVKDKNSGHYIVHNSFCYELSEEVNPEDVGVYKSCGMAIFFAEAEHEKFKIKPCPKCCTE